MKFKSIAMRIFVFVVPTILITTISFAGLSLYVSNSRINQTINEKMYASLNAADLEIQLELHKNAEIATAFARYAEMLKFDSFDKTMHESFISEIIMSNVNTSSGGVWFEPYAFDKSSYYFSSFSYEDANGGAVFVPNYSDSVDYYTEDWYIEGMHSRGDVAWSKVYYDKVASTEMVTASKPFFDSNGRFIGVGAADMKLLNIRDIVSSISVGDTGKAFIIGSNGEFISFFDENKSVEELMWEDEDEEVARLGNELVNSPSGITSFVRDGKNLRVYFMTMENVNWTLAITVDEDEIKMSALSSFASTVGIPLIGLLLIVTGTYFVTRYILRVVNKVNSFADLAASGDFTKRIDVTETDEFGIMEQRLNIMISNMDELRANTDELLKMAEAASHSKSDFLSRMSHEIRTPMNAIIGMTQIARGTNDDTRIKECLDKIDNASKHLLALINDILDMSKIEANKLDLTEDEFNLERVITGIYSMMLVKSDEKKQLLLLNIDKNTPIYLKSDELRFSQVITNLVSNAIKFTPEGGRILVDICEIKRDAEYTKLKISVNDTGIGLTQEQQLKLFNPFEQGDGSVSRQYGGTGLGLAISKRIVEIMGGEIWVISEPGKGSNFTFTIKARIGKGNISGDKIKIEQNNEELCSLRILIADDSVESNKYMKHVLHSLKLNCDSVSDGLEALEAMRKSVEENNPYDIIFMDYIMPNLNGIEATKKIKEISNNSTAIIMVSLYDWKDIEQEAGEAGVLKHISKPFSPSCVLDVINEVMFGERDNISKTDQSQLNFSENTILLAEDIEINREIVFSLLEDTQVNIEFAENGAQAVEMFESNPDKYDLILMDIQMPIMDGYEATRQIRNMDIKRAKTIPVIAMTANALSSDIKRCREAGMNDHLAKPIDTKMLLFKLNDYFFMKDYLNDEIW